MRERADHHPYPRTAHRLWVKFACWRCEHPSASISITLSRRRCTLNSRPTVGVFKVETCSPLPWPVADGRPPAFDS
jgi:hypothetical protein